MIAVAWSFVFPLLVVMFIIWMGIELWHMRRYRENVQRIRTQAPGTLTIPSNYLVDRTLFCYEVEDILDAIRHYESQNGAEIPMQPYVSAYFEKLIKECEHSEKNRMPRPEGIGIALIKTDYDFCVNPLGRRIFRMLDVIDNYHS